MLAFELRNLGGPLGLIVSMPNCVVSNADGDWKCSEILGTGMSCIDTTKKLDDSNSIAIIYKDMQPYYFCHIRNRARA